MATAVMPRAYKNFIKGEWVAARGGKAFENRNPANTDELVGMFPASTSEDVNLAVDAAKDAYKTWRLVPAPKRAEILFRAAELLVRRKEELARDMTREMGKVLTETRGDVQEAIDMTYYMAGEGRRQVAVGCAPKFKHCSLEMGGKNIIIVMDDANLHLAVDGAIWGGFGTTGQRCTAASRIAVHNKVYGEFLDRFVARARQLKVGNGLDTATEMGPAINETQLKQVMSYIEVGKQEGAKLLTGGHRLDTGACARGWFLEPTVFGDCSPRMRIAQEEIFGPVVSVLPADSLEQALDIANGVVYGLSASIYTRDINKAFHAARDIYTGIVYINAPTIGAETHLPFGGTKQTGNGHREAAIAAIDFFSEWKTIYIDYSDRLQRAQIDTASFGKVAN